MGKKNRKRRKQATPKKAQIRAISIELTEPAFEMIDQLVELGIFGIDQKDCCERLVYRSLQELVDQDFVILDDDEPF